MMKRHHHSGFPSPLPSTVSGSGLLFSAGGRRAVTKLAAWIGSSGSDLSFQGEGSWAAVCLPRGFSCCRESFAAGFSTRPIPLQMGCALSCGRTSKYPVLGFFTFEVVLAGNEMCSIAGGFAALI